jgi:hypothetical protein
MRLVRTLVYVYFPILIIAMWIIDNAMIVESIGNGINKP